MKDRRVGGCVREGGTGACRWAGRLENTQGQRACRTAKVDPDAGDRGPLRRTMYSEMKEHADDWVSSLKATCVR